MNPLRSSLLVIALPLVLLLGSCATNPEYASQFRFPILEGDVEEGKQAFAELGCIQCHTVNGVELPAWEGTSPIQFELGGEVWNVKTYAELATSIINPSHIISDEYRRSLPSGQRSLATSPMPYNDQMTIAQLVDIVMFLNSRYMLMPGYEFEEPEDEEGG